jgi:hypothetical protein
VFSVHFGLFISYLETRNAVFTVATDTCNRSNVLESIVPGDHMFLLLWCRTVDPSQQ